MKSERVGQLDFIRAISCVFILFTHFNAAIAGFNGNSFLFPNNTPVPIYYGGIYLGSIGVSLFFILTGASLYCSYKKNKPSILEFYKKRVLSIFPMYWVAYIWFFSYYLLRDKALPKGELRHLLINIGGFGGYLWSLNLTEGEYYLVGEWFLGCLLCIYLIFPIIFWLYKKTKYISLPLCLLFILLPTRNMDILFINRVPEIVFGFVYIDMLANAKVQHAIIAIVTAIILYIIRSKLNSFVYAVTVSICLFVVLGVAGTFLSNSKRLYNLTRWFAGLSYPIFLVHHQVIRLIVGSFNLSMISAPLAWSLVFVSFTIIILLATVLKDTTTKILLFFNKLQSEK
ncbi:MAG: acyltransferase [Oscillospiraceae bacterium]|nr:acyltransferase [Oscillospiraceae bacterium]